MRERDGLSITDLAELYAKPSRRPAPLRRIVARAGRHLVRLECDHLETLFGAEHEALGKRMPCERCGIARGATESGEKGRYRAQGERSGTGRGNETSAAGSCGESGPDAA